MTNTTDSTEARVRSVIEQTFKVTGGANQEYAMGALPGWDSMGHMQLVVALEQAFDVQIPSYALSEMTDVSSIVKVIEESR